MARIKPFEEHAVQYEDWFERNKFAYDSELQAVRSQLPENRHGVEIGVGSGRFAAPLGIKIGVEPAGKMREIARSRGIGVIGGIAEALPFGDLQFDFVLMVTAICFVDDLEIAFKEAYRVIRPNGSLIIGFIDRKSLLGKSYLKHKNENVFYRMATFYSVDEVVCYLKRVGFGDFRFSQTIFQPLTGLSDIELTKEGYGEGSFVVVSAIK
jgi:SAM-dependent methyltransferase